jgi:hypothetical protein
VESAPRFLQVLDEAASTRSAIDIDLRAVTYFDSVGVDALFTYATEHRFKVTIGTSLQLRDTGAAAPVHRCPSRTAASGDREIADRPGPVSSDY